MKENEYIQLTKNDKIVAAAFFALTVIFIIVSMTNVEFFYWIFERHHNQWSWYIRPLFLIPFCFFAYRRSWAGISVTIFCLLTSMFWFNPPATVSEEVEEFLQFEKDWLYGDWSVSKVILIATVPISFFAQGLAFWKRSLLLGLAVILLMACGKMVWSVCNAGEAGKSILLPAMAGLVVSVGLIYFGYRKLRKGKS